MLLRIGSLVSTPFALLWLDVVQVARIEQMERKNGQKRKGLVVDVRCHPSPSWLKQVRILTTRHGDKNSRRRRAQLCSQRSPILLQNEWLFEEAGRAHLIA